MFCFRVQHNKRSEVCLNSECNVYKRKGWVTYRWLLVNYTLAILDGNSTISSSSAFVCLELVSWNIRVKLNMVSTRTGRMESGQTHTHGFFTPFFTSTQEGTGFFRRLFLTAHCSLLFIKTTITRPNNHPSEGTLDGRDLISHIVSRHQPVWIHWKYLCFLSTCLFAGSLANAF